MEYWTEETPAKIGRSLGTLMDIDADIALGDSYIYVRLQLAAVRRTPSQVKVCAHGMEWIQSMEIEEEIYYCWNCGRWNHSTSNCKIPKNEKKEWRLKKKEYSEIREYVPLDYGDEIDHAAELENEELFDAESDGDELGIMEK
ncbi:hypothetical protein SUGI_0087300 [Cryptomeria japonica]|nr:hypothetical protein SUGI_0087300 [Cryptomeria japonica]